jgi:DNA polymerase
VVIGENPGRTEEKLGAPFVGMAGKVLDSALKKAGIERRQCHLTNATLCRGDSDKENDKAAVKSSQKLHTSLALLSVDPGQVN